jgi:hypothetical protein
VVYKYPSFHEGHVQPRYYAPPPKGPSAVWGLLGFLVALGILYLAFVAAPQQYTAGQAAAIGLAAIAVGGFITRKGKRGAVLGFLLLFLPLMLLGIALVGAGLSSTDDGSAGDGIGGIAEAFGEALGRTIVIGLGLALIIISFIAGGLGAIIGGISGWTSGKLFPAGRGEYPVEQHPSFDGTGPPPPRY